jgi:predicted NBD/HSP70 family sugar kinase
MKRTSRDIRLANRFDMLRHVIANRAVSRQEMVAATGLSLATVCTLAGELLDAGLLEEVGYQDSGGGRPRGLIAVAPGGGVLVGVDVAETQVHVQLFNLRLEVLAEKRLHPGESRPDQVVRHVVAGVRSVLRRPDTALGVGVSVPGQVERDGTVSVATSTWDWPGVPLRRLLGEQLHLPLYLDNPVRASVAAELWSGAARGREDVVMLTLGSGVGAGLALDGSLRAGEWGHSTLVLDGRPCHCGGRGCVAAYVGAPGVVQNLRELAPDSPLLRAGGPRPTIDALGRAAAEGDPVAAKVVAETARYLGAAVAGLVSLVHPQVIVLGGWVAARLGPALLEEVRTVVGRHASRRRPARTEIVLSPISTNPVSLGAAALALEGFLAGIGNRL